MRFTRSAAFHSVIATLLKSAHEGSSAQDAAAGLAKLLSPEAYDSAKGILSSHRDQLERVVQELLQRETLDERTFNSLLGRHARATAIDRSRGSADPGNGAPGLDGTADFKKVHEGS